MTFWAFLLALLFAWLAFEYGLHKHRHKKRRRILCIKFIKERGMTMIVGKAFPFAVVAFDTEGNPMAMPPTLGVATDNGTASVDSDGNNGVETPATEGAVAVTATLTLDDGTVFTDVLNDTAFMPKPVLASIKIVPTP